MSSRDQLTEAMAELLWERGYAATSPRDVMERAGVGQGSMYHHFSGKCHSKVKRTLYMPFFSVIGRYIYPNHMRLTQCARYSVSPFY